MKVMHLLFLVCARAYYRWALREIDPMHPDVGRIMLREQDLESTLRRIWH
jgi:hypothetical protein